MAQKISFPWGLPGLEDYQEFTFNLLGKDSAFCFLQAVRQPEVGLLVVNPYVYFSDYRIQLSREVAGRLKIEHQKQVAVLCTVNTSRGADEATVNLLATNHHQYKAIIRQTGGINRQQLFLSHSLCR
ncbi:MAG: flagellar assembly protein FliW [Candidatus Syntrophopropionicum ammoniitolerans]